jgi:hypothetical protein
MNSQLRRILPIIRRKDSINVEKVTSIIDKFGWLGPEQIGDDGNETLFLVIQHAELSIQEKYLPVMQEAVKKGNASAHKLAFLEDRIAFRQGKKQLYGTQVFLNLKTKEVFVLPLEDPDNLDGRRVMMGFKPMAVHLKEIYGIEWDIKTYWKDLPYVDSLMKTIKF